MPKSKGRRMSVNGDFSIFARPFRERIPRISSRSTDASSFTEYIQYDAGVSVPKALAVRPRPSARIRSDV